MRHCIPVTRGAITRTGRDTQERKRWTAHEHVDALPTYSANAFGAGVAVDKRPRSLAVRAVNLDFPAAERRGRRVREPVVLPLRNRGIQSGSRARLASRQGEILERRR